jgi:tetratricopeptide (TPR) repeat protein
MDAAAPRDALMVDARTSLIGSAYHDAGMPNTTDRLTKLLKLLDAEPDDAFCLYSVAQEHAKAGDHPAAISYFDRTIASDRNYLYAYFHKARSEQALGEIDRAAQSLREGLARARTIGDVKAIGELSAFLDELT